MAHVEQSIKDYGKKSGWWIRNREFKVTPTPLLWRSENKRLVEQAFLVLQSGLVAVPLLAGMDKFVNIIGEWSHYLAPVIPQTFQMSANYFLHLVGFVEIIMALGLALWPRAFSWVFMLWMSAIVLNLLVLGNYLDIALRDLGLAAAGFALWRLSLIKEEEPLVVSESTDATTEIITPELAN